MAGARAARVASHHGGDRRSAIPRTRHSAHAHRTDPAQASRANPAGRASVARAVRDRTRMTARPAVAPAIAALVICSSVTACEWFVPGVNLAYGGEGMHIAIGATRATVCLVVGGLAWARFARSRALLDLSIAIAFETMFVESAFFLDLPTLLQFDQVTPFSAWSSTAATVVAATVLLAGALARPRAVERRAAALVLAAGVAALATTAVLLLVYAGSLPQAVDPGVSPLTRPTRVFFGNPVVLAAQAAAAAITLTAAIRLLSSRLAGREPLLVWLAPALVIDAAASANY